MRGSHKISVYRLLAPLAALLSGCAADLASISNNSTGNPSITAQQQAEIALIGTKVNFFYSDFFTLTSPNPVNSCAGDVKNYYDPFALDSSSLPQKLQTDILSYSNSTIMPSFIKNISVDMTDANAPFSSNNAYTCSLKGSGAPPTSSCATFDYGAINGIPSSLGGSMILIGGLSTPNTVSVLNPNGPPGLPLPYASTSFALNCGLAVPSAVSTSSTYTNTCSTSMFGLTINNLPASAAGVGSTLAPGLLTASGPISSWVNFSGASNYSGPPGVLGGSVTHDSGVQKILLFGGVSPLSAMGSYGAGATNYDSYVYDLNADKWIALNVSSGGNHTYSFSVPAALQNTADYYVDASGNATSFLIPKSVGDGRSDFGYVAVPGSTIDHLSLGTGTVQEAATGAGIDTTDRVVIVGGVGSCYGGACTDMIRFNPTYGPEYFDAESPASPIMTAGAFTFAKAVHATQWIDSYYVQNISNGNPSSKYIPSPFPLATPTPTPAPPQSSVAFGAVALNNNYTASAGVGVNSALTTPTSPGAGYVLVAGGFHGYYGTEANLNYTTATCPTIAQCGDMQIALKWYDSAWAQANEQKAANFSSATNLDDYSGTIPLGREMTPAQWTHVADAASPRTTPWLGGAVMIKGINVNPGAGPTMPGGAVISAQNSNQVVFIGGSDCKNYMNTSSSCPNWPAPGNSGYYWVFGPDPAFTLGGGNYPTLIAMGGTAPKNAGMAAARGVDTASNPFVVAWGGMQSAGVPDNSGKVYYLYSSAGTPTWASYTVPAGAGPRGLANAAMVFSHVTNKFYLFGGYDGTNFHSETWQLSVSPAACLAGTVGTCQFAWTLLNSNAGQTCYPNCPPLRRSHRMVEVNYNNINMPAEPICSASSTPCSFGIFMEGGTFDGSSNYADRWMFDPTANGGAGHWQLMGEMPPRTLASIASVDYQIPSTQAIVHRAVLFGGETGMANPAMAASGYFVPPTLGDTWMFDYDWNKWSRVQLYGKRYDMSALPNLNNLSEIQARSSTMVNDSTTNTFSPPPLSGTTMVTRTLTRSNHLSSDTPTNLAIPEVFMFGGRAKDGSFSAFNRVYKFCAGSTGEKPFPMSLKGTVVPAPDDASCDAYNATTNPESPNPINSYVGRWLNKTPFLAGGNVDPTLLGSFMGAGAYDSNHDLIVSYGGLTATAFPNTVTNTAQLSINTSIFEYTPPSSVGAGSASAQYNGAWNQIDACAESSVPTGRYGHSISYDTLNQWLVVVGGYDATGAALTESQTYLDGSTQNIPEVWTAYRIDSALPSGIPSKNIPVIATQTFPCYYWSKITLFGNSNATGQSPPFGGLSHASGIFVPSTGYNTGFYSTFDNACTKAGPIFSDEPSVNKQLVGGAYIDIDRTQLASTENVILNLTFIPMSNTNTRPDQSYYSIDETALFKIHLVHTGQAGDTIRAQIQPRAWIYTANPNASNNQFPNIVPDISVIAPPTGQIRQEQVYIPLSADPSIDRIRIERVSGSAILIDASIYRLGVH